MGPRSDNRGYGHLALDVGEELVPSMGPRSDNRGYGRSTRAVPRFSACLQWVHGPITVVMDAAGGPQMGRLAPSMGPRSDNRGYGRGL